MQVEGLQQLELKVTHANIIGHNTVHFCSLEIQLCASCGYQLQHQSLNLPANLCTNMNSTWAFYLSKPPCSISCIIVIKLAWPMAIYHKINSAFVLLRMSVNTNCEKIRKFVYTLHHIVVSQTTLSVLEGHSMSQSKQCAYQYVQHLGISISASHHGSNAPYIIATMLVFVG